MTSNVRDTSQPNKSSFYEWSRGYINRTEDGWFRFSKVCQNICELWQMVLLSEGVHFAEDVFRRASNATAIVRAYKKFDPFYKAFTAQVKAEFTWREKVVSCVSASLDFLIPAFYGYLTFSYSSPLLFGAAFLSFARDLSKLKKHWEEIENPKDSVQAKRYQKIKMIADIISISQGVLFFVKKIFPNIKIVWIFSSFFNSSFSIYANYFKEVKVPRKEAINDTDSPPLPPGTPMPGTPIFGASPFNHRVFDSPQPNLGSNICIHCGKDTRLSKDESPRGGGVSPLVMSSPAQTPKTAGSPQRSRSNSINKDEENHRVGPGELVHFGLPPRSLPERGASPSSKSSPISRGEGSPVHHSSVQARRNSAPHNPPILPQLPAIPERKPIVSSQSFSVENLSSQSPPAQHRRVKSCSVDNSPSRPSNRCNTKMAPPPAQPGAQLISNS